MKYITGEFQNLRSRGFVSVDGIDSGNYESDGGANKNIGYWHQSFINWGLTGETNRGFDFTFTNAVTLDDGLRYYAYDAQVTGITATSDNTAAGTITVSLDDHDFVQFTTDEYWKNGDRNTAYTKGTNTYTGTNKGWTRLYSSPSCHFNWAASKRFTGEGYLENITFNVGYGFRVLEESPSVGGSSAGTFSGSAHGAITTNTSGSYNASLTYSTNDGYNFIGWNNGLGNSQTITAYFDGKTKYQPVVERVKHYITLDSDSGYLCTVNTNTNAIVSNMGVATRTSSYYINTTNSSLNFTNIQARKTYYTFTGWKDVKTGSVVNALQLNAKNLISGTGNTSTNRVFKAQYAPVKYNYILEGLDNKNSTVTKLNSIDNQHTFPIPKSRLGYDFNYWEDKDNSLRVFKSGAKVPLNDSKQEKFFANFTPQTYFITYDTNGGSYSTGSKENPTQIKMDVEASETCSYPKIPGYETQWQITREGYDPILLSVQETKEHKIEATTGNGLIGNRTYTAIYSKIEYKINYIGHSDSNNGGNDTDFALLGSLPGKEYVNVENDTSVTLGDNYYPGYEFLGWVDMQSPKEPEKTLTININPAKDPDKEVKNRTYKAYFKPINYKVEFKYDSPAEESGSAKITPSYAPNNGKEFFRLDPDGGGYSTMTVEDIFTSKLIEPRAKGYTFKYWNVYVDNKKITTSQNIIPQIMLNNSGDKILGTYTYEAIYEPIVYTLNYDVIDGIHRDYLNHENTKLRSSYKTNKDRSLMKLEDDVTDVSIYRPGYEFTGFSMSGGVTKTRSSSVDYVLPANTYAENLTFNLSFAPYNTTVRAIPKLFYRGEFTLDFPIFEDEENNGIPWVIFKDEDENISTNSISITYYDDVTVRRELVFDEKRYVFKGWQYPGKKETDALVEGERNTSIVVNPITEEGSLEENTYYAIFEYVDYSISIYPYCNGLLTSGKYGSVLVGGQNEASYMVSEIDDVVLPLGIEPLKNSVKYQNNAYTISNLHYRDTIELAMMPYATNDNARYHFDYWDVNKKINNIIDRSTLLKLTVNQETWIEGTQKNLYPQFTKIPYVNTISTESEDSQTLYNLFNKTISGFILINAITTLGSYGFLGCSFLEYAFLPGTKTIQQGSFQDCTQLKTAILSSEENLAGSIGVNTFKNCSNLNALILPTYRINLNDLFSSEDLGENKELWSLFRKGMGRIYVPEEHLSWYIAEGTNWFTYANIIRPIRTNGPIYKEPVPIPDEGEVEE